VRGRGELTGAVGTVARAIESTVRATSPDPDEAAFAAACVRNQALRVCAELPDRSAEIRRSRVALVAAVYDLHTGLVRRLE
jgi:carbonic anhydrase